MKKSKEQASVRLFIVTGEESGDRLGACVLDGLAAQNIAHHAWGVGGVPMQARGFESLAEAGQFNIIGITQILPALFRLHKLANRLIDSIIENRPDVILTIDNKAFSLRFARRLKKRMKRVGWSAPIIHLVAPTVWAWGGWRAKQFAKAFDHLMCLYPFEAAYFDGIEVTVVGHPLLEGKHPSRSAARKALGFDSTTPLIALIPGSRASEVRALLPDMLVAMDIIRETLPSAQAIIPMAEPVAPMIEAMVAPLAMTGVEESVARLPQRAFVDTLAASDYGMICSGTATLEAALAGLSGSVYYRPDWLTAMFGRFFVNRQKIILANVVLEAEVYPLYLGTEFTPQSMASDAIQALQNRAKMPPKRLSTKDTSAKFTAQKLTVSGGFGKAVAQTLMRILAAHRSSIGI